MLIKHAIWIVGPQPAPLGATHLAEQRRIVAKVDELMAVLGALEATLPAQAGALSAARIAAAIAKFAPYDARRSLQTAKGVSGKRDRPQQVRQILKTKS